MQTGIPAATRRGVTIPKASAPIGATLLNRDDLALKLSSIGNLLRPV
jgi:hypothetical protein